ncbi:RNA-directed DNA polymerase, eukaryota, reverse transcriptase zinc-binding domain protein [Tanacetum coccineum]
MNTNFSCSRTVGYRDQQRVILEISRTWRSCFQAKYVHPHGFIINFHIKGYYVLTSLLNLDKVLWKSNAGKLGGFSVKNVWTDLSEVRPKVSWYKMVWFSQNIPCHAFISWLAINKKLKTQDKVVRWQNIDDLKCSLCNLVQDNHSYLFFNCEFSAKVWNHFKDQMRHDYALDDLYQIISYIVARPINRSIWNIIHRLVIGAVVYFLWQEQNLRLFKLIRDNVRLRLLSLKIRRSKQSLDVAKIWKFHVLQREVDCVPNPVQ